METPQSSLFLRMETEKPAGCSQERGPPQTRRRRPRARTCSPQSSANRRLLWAPQPGLLAHAHTHARTLMHTHARTRAHTPRVPVCTSPNRPQSSESLVRTPPILARPLSHSWGQTKTQRAPSVGRAAERPARRDGPLPALSREAPRPRLLSGQTKDVCHSGSVHL